MPAPTACLSFRILGAGILLASLTGCASLPAPPPASGTDLEQAWQLHRQDLSALQHWNLEGRISIQAGQEGWHASLHWEQRPADYAIDISTPLGQDVVRLRGDADGVSMRTSDGEQRAADPETLLYNRVGWRIPLVGMRYWVLGLPDPAAAPVTAKDRELDTLGRLAKLHQSRWNIDFRRYVKVGNLDLPDKIFMSNQTGDVHLEVRLVVEKWNADVVSLSR